MQSRMPCAFRRSSVPCAPSLQPYSQSRGNPRANSYCAVRKRPLLVKGCPCNVARVVICPTNHAAWNKSKQCFIAQVQTDHRIGLLLKETRATRRGLVYTAAVGHWGPISRRQDDQQLPRGRRREWCGLVDVCSVASLAPSSDTRAMSRPLQLANFTDRFCSCAGALSTFLTR